MAIAILGKIGEWDKNEKGRIPQIKIQLTQINS